MLRTLLNLFSYGTIPILITSYDMFRKYAVQINQVTRLDLLVCDEGHRLKSAGGSKTMDSLRYIVNYTYMLPTWSYIR